MDSLVMVGLILPFTRIANVNKTEISWDVLGVLPGHCPLLFYLSWPDVTHTDWLKKINDEKTVGRYPVYGFQTTDKGEPIYFFLFGMALFYLPFFWIGQLFRFILRIPAMGSASLSICPRNRWDPFITLIGLYYLRKNLKYFFSDKITAVVMLILVFGYKLYPSPDTQKPGTRECVVHAGNVVSCGIP